MPIIFAIMGPPGGDTPWMMLLVMGIFVLCGWTYVFFLIIKSIINIIMRSGESRETHADLSAGMIVKKELIGANLRESKENGMEDELEQHLSSLAQKKSWLEKLGRSKSMEYLWAAVCGVLWALAIGFIAFLVLPQCRAMYEELGIDAPLPTRVLFAIPNTIWVAIAILAPICVFQGWKCASSHLSSSALETIELIFILILATIVLFFCIALHVPQVC